MEHPATVDLLITLIESRITTAEAMLVSEHACGGLPGETAGGRPTMNPMGWSPGPKKKETASEGPFILSTF